MMMRRKNHGRSRSVHFDPCTSQKEILSIWNSLVILRAANSASGRLPGSDKKRSIVRISLREKIRPEVKNTAINICPSALLQHVLVFTNAAIVDGQADILKPVSVLRIIFKQAQEKTQLASGLHNTKKFAKHLVLMLEIVKRFDTNNFCEIATGRGNLVGVATVVTHVREGAALVAR